MAAILDMPPQTGADDGNGRACNNGMSAGLIDLLEKMPTQMPGDALKHMPRPLERRWCNTVTKVLQKVNGTAANLDEHVGWTRLLRCLPVLLLRLKWDDSETRMA